MSKNRITESEIERFALELLEKSGYQYIYGPDIAPDSQTPERQSFEDVILLERLTAAVARINPKLSAEVREDAIKQLLRLNSPELIANNEAFHRMLTEGIKVSYQKDGNNRGDLVWLIDFTNPDKNDFFVLNQYTVIENNVNKRPDVILFVNGLPLVVIELKNPADENSTIHSAFRQIQTYKQAIPTLFTYNGFTVISDGLEARAGTISAGFSRFMAWKTSDGKLEASPLIGQLETLIKGMLCKTTLLDLIRHFIVFEKARKEDKDTGIITIETVKKLAAYHQYYAVNLAVESTLRASGYAGTSASSAPDKRPVAEPVEVTGMVMEPPATYGLPSTETQPIGDKKGGVVWHTQGSGKSLSMVFYAGKIVLAMDNPTIVMITDRNDLDDQLFDTFASSKQLLRQEPVQAESRDKLKELLKVASGGIVFATIQKFFPDEGNVYEQLSNRKNIIVIADEAHRTQYGFKAKTVDAKGKKLVSDLDEELKQDELTETQKAKAKWTQLEALIGSADRIRRVALDIVTHFELRQEVFDGKSMIVTMSRRIAAELYAEIIKLRPLWHNSDLRKGALKVVMTSASSDGPEISKHHTIKEQRRALADRMKDPEDELKLVIVCDMWLTGFDVPCLHTLYIDKPMQGHNLMQAIARVNRVYKDKTGGLIVDYLGIAADLKKALSFYSNSGGKGDPAVMQAKAVQLMLEKIEIISQMFHGFAYEDYFEANTSKKLSFILAAEEHILGLDDGKKRFIDEVTALSQAFSIAIPHEQAMDAKDEVAFFQAVKARLAKFDWTDSGKTDEEIETAIRQVIDKALVTEQVIDVFDAAGIKKPDISILSEEFLLEVRNMEHKNIALEVLKKLLNDEIKARTRKNLVQGRTLMEMLENSIKKYHNKILTAAEVINELIKLSKEIKEMDKEPKEMGLSDHEYAFYTAIANNESAQQLMEKDKLRELAVVLFEKVRENASIDWTIKESVKAKLKVIVKRILRQYGYPPDMQMLATETVLKQAELIADEMTKGK